MYPPKPYLKTHLPKMYPVNLIPKSNPEKRTGLILASKQSLSKHSPPNPCLKKLSRPTSPPKPYLKTHPLKTYPPNPYPKTHLPKTYLTNPDQNAIPKSVPA